MVFKLTLPLKVLFLYIGLEARGLKCKHGRKRLYRRISNEKLMEHDIWCLYGNILILLPHSSTCTLVKCRKVSVTIIDLYIHQYNNTDIWEPPNWSTYCLMFNVVTFSHDYLRQQRSQNPMNSSCCNTCQTWTKWCNKSLVTRLISIFSDWKKKSSFETWKSEAIHCRLLPSGKTNHCCLLL